MHRAGTSLTANILHHLGVYMGPPGLDKWDPANECGEYEHPDFTRLNDQLLQEGGCFWYSPQDFEFHKVNYVKECPEFFKSDKELIGFKDPRVVWTYDFYSKYVENPHFVCVIRNRDSVINSIFRTHINQIIDKPQTKEYVGFLYDYHYANNYLLLQNYPHINVQFENYFTDFKNEVDKISEFVGTKNNLRKVNIVKSKYKHF